MTKTKHEIKALVKSEVERLQALGGDTRYEFKRINTLNSNLIETVKLLQEDCFLSQLM